MMAREAADETVLDLFVERVRALTPSAWGTLQAAGARYAGRNPLAAAGRARLLAPVVSGRTGPGAKLPPSAAKAALFVAEIAQGLGLGARSPATVPPNATPDQQRTAARFATIQTLAAANGDDHGNARTILFGALIALTARSRLTPDALRASYAPVEPVIPLTSIGAV
jgi:hypothetical protein